MSNFLERIAATVGSGSGPAKPRLQPMLGSRFAPAGPLASTAAALGTEAAPEVSSETVAGWEPAADGPLGGRRPPATGAAQPMVSQPRFVARDEPPLLGDYHGEASLQALLSHTRADEDLGAHTQQAARSETADSRQDAHEKVPGIRPSVVPLQAMRAAVPPRNERQPQTPAQRSEPDEIHIHIGRIEVASVPPQLPRTTPPLPRKGLNLDEYLRRGGRR